MGKAFGWPIFVGNTDEHLPDFVRDFPPDLAEAENDKLRPEPCRIPARQDIIEESEDPNSQTRGRNA